MLLGKTCPPHEIGVWLNVNYVLIVHVILDDVKFSQTGVRSELKSTITLVIQPKWLTNGAIMTYIMTFQRA